MTLNAAALSAAEEMMSVGRDIVARGLALASGGNLSIRLDEATFVVTSSGSWLDRLTPADFSLMSSDGDLLDGNPRPSSEWKLHQRSYLARPDSGAIVHVHPQYAVLLTALGHSVRLITLDHAVYVKSVGVTPFFHNGSDKLADSAAEQARDHNCIIMSNHGCCALGKDIEMAFRRALNLEEAATATYRALLLGNTEAAFPESDFAALHHA